MSKAEKIGNVIMTIMTIAGALLLLWLGASWIDVVLNNSTTAEHASWNLFVLLTR